VLVAGSRPSGQSPAKPLPSRTVIDPPATGAPVAVMLVWLGAALELVEAVGPEDDELPLLLHAAAVVSTSAAAPARQAVRIDISRNLTAFTYS
jgi:hypothetical protein